MTDSEYDHLHPMEETEKKFVVEEDDEIFNANLFDPEKRGKWMLFYPLDVMDEKWQQAVKLYRAGELTGIQSMKCSTAAPNERAGKTADKKGAIRFACGPCDDEKVVKSYGKNLIEKMAYTSNYGFVAYKTDEQSEIGTRATGSKNNYSCRLPVRLYNFGSDGDKDTELQMPSTISEKEYILFKTQSIAEKYPVDFKESGLWQLNPRKQWLDSNWVRAHKLYLGNELPGISAIKVSRGSPSYPTGFIMFFCGPVSDIELMKTYGRIVLDKMKYMHPKGKASFMFFSHGKSNELCTLPVPTPWTARK